MADDRGAVEPLLNAVTSDAWWPDKTVRACRATSRVWRSLMEPIAARLFVSALNAPAYWTCRACNKRADLPGHSARVCIFQSCVSPPVAAWVARSLLATATQEPPASVRGMCECGQSTTVLVVGNVFQAAAHARSPEVVASLRRHLVFNPNDAGFGLECAVFRCNEPMAHWMAETALLNDKRWRDAWVAKSVKAASTVGMVHFLARLFDLRKSWRAGTHGLRDAGRAALTRAAKACDVALCAALHAEIGFLPREVGAVFRALVTGGVVCMASWLVNHIGVLRSAVTHESSKLLVRLAKNGNVALLGWIAVRLGLGLNDGWIQYVVSAAAKAGHVPVLEWVATFGWNHWTSAMLQAATNGHSAVVVWVAQRDEHAASLLDQALCEMIDRNHSIDQLTLHHEFGWASLGPNQVSRRRRFESVCKRGAIETFNLIERLGIEHWMVHAND